MTRALLGLIALGLFGCATPRVAPRFDQPSTQPIQKAHKQAIGHVQSAQAKLDDLEKSHEELKLQVEPIKVDLANALSDLNTSESARVELDSKLKTETTKANKLANDYDAVHKQVDDQNKIIAQVNSKWGLGAFAYGFQRLARHLLVLAAVAIGLLVAVSVLGLIFPAFGAVLKIACSFISSAFSRILRR